MSTVGGAGRCLCCTSIYESSFWFTFPVGLGCSTVLYPEAAAQHAASILALNDHMIWAKMKAKQLRLWQTIKEADERDN